MSTATPVQWLPMLVEGEDGSEERSYWTPAFTERMDVFHEETVVRRPDGSVNGTLDHAKMDRYRFVGVHFDERMSTLMAHRELRRRVIELRCDIGVAPGSAIPLVPAGSPTQGVGPIEVRRCEERGGGLGSSSPRASDSSASGGS